MKEGNYEHANTPAVGGRARQLGWLHRSERRRGMIFNVYSPVTANVAGAPTALIGTFEKFDDWVGIVAAVDMGALVGTFEVEEET